MTDLAKLLPPGFLEPSTLSQDNFVHQKKIFSEVHKCIKCGTEYTLHTPYQKCNPDTRDLCSDCILALPKSDRTYTRVRRETE